MAKIDKKYHDLLNEILDKGYRYEDSNRKGVFRKQISDYKIVHDFKDGFPAITTKKLYWEGIVGELLWILRGDTNIKYLVDNNINIWNKDGLNYLNKQTGDSLKLSDFVKNVKEGYLTGDIGRGYGAQLRDWTENTEGSTFGNTGTTIDQFTELINTLKTNPMATKKTVTFWNPAEKDQCALTPCHWSFEVLVEPIPVEERCAIYKERHRVMNCLPPYEVGLDSVNIPKYKFTLKWHQHSVDTFLGLPFNIASYALLAQIIGRMTNMVPKGIIGDLSNVHIYEPHLDAVKEQLGRDVGKYSECELILDYDTEMGLKMPSLLQAFNKTLSQVEIKDFTLNNYKSYPRIPAEMLAYSE